MRYLYFIVLIISFVMVACTPTTEPDPQPNRLTAPLLISPEPEIEFIESDIEVQWQWEELQPHQLYVLRVWFEEEPPQEIWLEEKNHNIQEMIDNFGREVGLFYWQVAVVNRNEEGGFASMGSDWSESRPMQRVRRFTLDPYPVEMQSDMARHFAGQEYEDVFELANTMRDFIHTNTDVTQQLSYEADYSDAMSMLFDHSQGIGEAPQLYCDGMSTGMLTILRELGIESRIIYLYGEGNGWINQHTTLEVFNTQTQRWEVHDTTFNHYFVDQETNERMSIEQMVFGDRGRILACSADGACSPIDQVESMGIYLGALRYGYTTEVWVNPNRMNISRRVEAHENNNFPEFIARISGFQQRDLIFRFDTWETEAQTEEK